MLEILNHAQIVNLHLHFLNADFEQIKLTCSFLFSYSRCLSDLFDDQIAQNSRKHHLLLKIIKYLHLLMWIYLYILSIEFQTSLSSILPQTP